jgi:hypothetical protein
MIPRPSKLLLPSKYNSCSLNDNILLARNLEKAESPTPV